MIISKWFVYCGIKVWYNDATNIKTWRCITLIGQNIKKYRKEKGFTQRELADLIGVSVQSISKWETDTGAPDISQVVPLASALDISTDALFDYEHHTMPKDFEELRKDYSKQ